MPEENVCFSLNNEDFIYTDLFTLMSAMEDDGLLEVGAEYWESDYRSAKPEDAFRVELILEEADCRIEDEVGEVYDSDCSNVSTIAKLELRELLYAWSEKHVQLSRYNVLTGASRKMSLAAELVAEYHAGMAETQEQPA